MYLYYVIYTMYYYCLKNPVLSFLNLLCSRALVSYKTVSYKKSVYPIAFNFKKHLSASTANQGKA